MERLRNVNDAACHFPGTMRQIAFVLIDHPDAGQSARKRRTHAAVAKHDNPALRSQQAAPHAQPFP